jgi:hypothetical protein
MYPPGKIQKNGGQTYPFREKTTANWPNISPSGKPKKRWPNVTPRKNCGKMGKWSAAKRSPLRKKQWQPNGPWPNVPFFNIQEWRPNIPHGNILDKLADELFAVMCKLCKNEKIWPAANRTSFQLSKNDDLMVRGQTYPAAACANFWFGKYYIFCTDWWPFWV